MYNKYLKSKFSEQSMLEKASAVAILKTITNVVYDYFAVVGHEEYYVTVPFYNKLFKINKT